MLLLSFHERDAVISCFLFYELRGLETVGELSPSLERQVIGVARPFATSGMLESVKIFSYSLPHTYINCSCTSIVMK